MLRIGVISSSNGGAFKAFYKQFSLSNENVLVITDRVCGIENFALDESIRLKRIEEKDNESFSRQACDFIALEGGVDVIFLFYTRLVTKALFKKYFTINFHPSLLPAFTGFSPVKRALKAGVKYFGTTAHIVSEEADDGKILAQSCIPISNEYNEEALERISFVQKVYQMALISEMLLGGGLEFKEGEFVILKSWPHSLLFNPSIKCEKTLDEIKSLDQKNQTHIFNLLK